jgi:hypothetical protein
MTKIQRLAASALTLFALGSGVSQAALIDRGGGLIYDDVLNVTWMQDVQYVNQLGLSRDGILNHWEALAAADSLEYYDSVRDTTWSDWRLPTAYVEEIMFDTTGTTSELAYMYYVNLQFAPMYEHDRFRPDPTSDAYNPFLNLNRAVWFSNTSDSRPDTHAWIFHFHFGSQEGTERADAGRVWFVRDGDVGQAQTSVPEPGTLALFGLGLIGAGITRRRKKAA